jgi:serine phosphatase RsbU (regulator of sigma subunit)
LLVAAFVPRDDVPSNVPGGLMVLGVLVATGLGGLACGLVSGALAVVVLNYSFLTPADEVLPSSGTEAVALVVYAVVVIAVCVTTETILRRARREAETTVQLQAHLDAERAALVAMQRALLPTRPPVGDAFEVALRYQAADEIAALGGDWYAVVPLGSQCVGLAIGDVVGHGTPSIALMAEVRFALRTLASEGAEPAALMSTLNRLVRRFEQGAMCTALYGIWDAREGSWVQAVAGHPPPVLRNGGKCRLLDETRPGLPLGVADDTAYPATRVPIEGASTLLLYTDGLVERRGESLDVSLQRLCDVVRGASDAPGQLCDDVMATLVTPRAHDDVAIVAARTRRNDR